MPSQEIRDRVNGRLEELYRRHLSLHGDEIAGYYESGFGYRKPEVPGKEQEIFSICLASTDGEVFVAGDHEQPFALQSISKLFVYGLALEVCGRERVLARVGVEPSGDAFNSIVFDERNNRPFNPMVNAGALATTYLVGGEDGAEPALQRILDALGRYAGSEALNVEEEIFEAEMRTADRNRATAYLMRGEGMLEGDVEATLALYLRQCSVRVTCRELALMAATLANGGVNPATGERALGSRHVRDVLSVMHTCGMYDFAGEWAYRVGIPAKSGVSGGVLAVVPGKLGIGVFSPGLDVYGNSVRGTAVCEEISERLGLHVFADAGEDVLLGPRP
ncbi:Glutaminase [uncultured Rubrobacteraceae bacterium]|uniref:Glutaminase n=1 Tax=uncultured Rubrobacteraceae bacterium TaxID=349277 RepID=A0A6J4P749_9ACTN|nr:Glutaminase [uncultured Rubrobacteraceae bacterium]